MKRSTFYVLAVAAVFLGMGLPGVSEAGVWYVNCNDNLNGDGRSWGTAFNRIQAAIDNGAALDNDSVIQVWVAAGTCFENIEIKDRLALYGGFPVSDNAAFGDRDPERFVTIIDGGWARSVVRITGGYSPSNRIDGFTIQNGIGEGTPPTTHGGGIFIIDQVNLAIENNLIRNNSAFSGGGIHSQSVRRYGVTITNNVIDNNTTTWGGGGIHIKGSSIITGNVITRNNAGSGNGGGIADDFAYDTYVDRIIHNNVISGNTADQGGGIYCYHTWSSIANNIISGNSANSGGGVYWYGGAANAMKLVNNTIVGNSTPGEAGGGIYLYGAVSAQIANNIVAFGSQGINASGSTAILYNNDFFNWPTSDYIGINPGIDDISLDPGFTDNTTHHLRFDSPCINMGNNSFVDNSWIDMDGQPRINPVGGLADIGADEYFDLPAPAVDNTAPRNGEVGVPRTTLIRIDFNQTVREGAGFNNIKLEYTDKKGTHTVDCYNDFDPFDPTVLVMDPFVTLNRSTYYTVTVPRDAVENMAGRNLSDPVTFTFKTGTN